MKKIKIAILFFLNFYISSQTPYFYHGFPLRIDSVRNVSVGTKTPLITDLDKDGQKEIIIGTSDFYFIYKSMLYVIKSNGTHQTGFPKFFPHNWLRAYVSGDINNDGYLDIVLRTDSVLYVLDRFGNNISGFPVTSNLEPGLNFNFVHLYDLDSDGKLEIITDVSNGIIVFNWNGSVRSGWPVRFGNSRPNKNCAIADIDNDGFGEIVLTTYKSLNPGIDSSHLRIYRHNGVVFNSNWPIADDSLYNTFMGGPSIYVNPQNPSHKTIILSNDKEINFPEYRYRLTEYDINGNILKRIYFSGWNDISSTSMGDINRDGLVDFANSTLTNRDMR
ncbi:MAG: VCBS repeat-containing protein, partial [Ignavibacteria bacterium]|nr:VCBS repeat-containing protein [Ignavibacteria bacterium]